MTGRSSHADRRLRAILGLPSPAQSSSRQAETPPKVVVAEVVSRQLGFEGVPFQASRYGGSAASLYTSRRSITYHLDSCPVLARVTTIRDVRQDDAPEAKRCLRCGVSQEQVLLALRATQNSR